MSDIISEPKKVLPLLILDILKRCTNEENTLTQKEISDILMREFGVKADRKTIKSNLMTLIECGDKCGFSIGFNTETRVNNGEENEKYTDFYFEHRLTQGELRFMIDSITAYSSIPEKQKADLIGSMQKMTDVRSRIKNVYSMADYHAASPSIFLNIETLEAAVESRKIVKFTYCEYGTDARLHPKKRRYAVRPYRLLYAEDRYYLLCGYMKSNEIVNYRVDKMTDIEITDEVYRGEPAIDLPRHKAEHIYMFSGKTERVTFRADRRVVSDIIDWFGKGAKFIEESDDRVIASVTVNHEAMKYWALQYADHVRVLSPKSLVDDIHDSLMKAAEKYERDEQ